MNVSTSLWLAYAMMLHCISRFDVHYCECRFKNCFGETSAGQPLRVNLFSVELCRCCNCCLQYILWARAPQNRHFVRFYLYLACSRSWRNWCSLLLCWPPYFCDGHPWLCIMHHPRQLKTKKTPLVVHHDSQCQAAPSVWAHQAPSKVHHSPPLPAVPLDWVICL